MQRTPLTPFAPTPTAAEPRRGDWDISPTSPIWPISPISPNSFEPNFQYHQQRLSQPQQSSQQSSQQQGRKREQAPALTLKLESVGRDATAWADMLSDTKDTASNQMGDCAICVRTTFKLTQHHFYPRRTHGSISLTPEQENATVSLCWPCHCVVHRIIPHQLLASYYNSPEAILSHGGIKSWLTWARERTMTDIHALMIPVTPRGKRRDIIPSRPRANFAYLVPAIEKALDQIWAEGGFPGEDLQGSQRATALRRRVAEVVGSREVQKPEIKYAMRSRPEYHDWHQKVFVDPK